MVLMNLFAGQQCIDLWTWRGVGKRSGMNEDSGIETYTLPLIKLDSQWKFTVCPHCMTPGAKIYCSVII